MHTENVSVKVIEEMDMQNAALSKLIMIIGMVITAFAIITGGRAVQAAELAIVANEQHTDAVANQFIMRYDNTESMSKAIQRVEAEGGTIIHTYDSITSFAALLTPSALFAIRSDNTLTYIEADMVARGMGVDVLAHNQTDSARQMDNTHDGENVNIYILDSGIDDNLQIFSGRVVQAYDAINDGATACGDHGTGIASLIGGDNGVASAAILHSVRVLDCDLITTTSTVLSAIEWINQNAQTPAIVNISVGTYNSDAYDSAAEALIAKGIAVVVAAGNVYAYDACHVSPAGANGVVTVAAVNDNQTPAWFTAMGPCVDIFANGVDIEMAADGNGSWISNGTSFAAPHITGCAARFLQNNPDATPAELVEALQDASIDKVKEVPEGTTTKWLNCTQRLKVSHEFAHLNLDIENAVPTAVTLNDTIATPITLHLIITLSFAFLLVITMLSNTPIASSKA